MKGLGGRKVGLKPLACLLATDPALQSTCSLTFSRKLPPPQPEALS